MHPSKITSFEGLRSYLANFTTWEGGDVYDEGGAIIVFGALLDNLKENHVHHSAMSDYLTSEQIATLSYLASQLEPRKPEVDCSFLKSLALISHQISPCLMVR